jgi:transcriptional regulator with XRE-family HTH domain
VDGMTIGQRLRAVRHESGMTQTEFAKQLRLSKNAISVMEQGHRNMSKRTIASVCERFGVSEKWLTTGDGEMRVDPEQHGRRHLAEICARRGITGKRRAFLEKYLLMSPQAQDAILAYAEVLENVSQQDRDDPASGTPSDK